jgi:hypothetical protein
MVRTNERPGPATALRAGPNRLSPGLQAFLGTRLLVWLIAVYAWLWFRSHRVPSGDLGYVTAVWSRADSAWFISIAQHGYIRDGGAVFYPLYPLALAGVGRLFGGYYVTAGIVVSLLCGSAAFVLLYRLALAHLDRDAALRTVLYAAVFPMSLFLQAVYSESLYLLCAVATFVLAERGRIAAASATAGLAMLTRVAGIGLFPSLVVMAWRRDDRRAALASLAPAPLIAALYPFWLWLKLDAPRAAIASEAGWHRHISPAGPLGGLWNGLRATWAGIEQLATGDRVHAFWTGSHSDALYVATHNLEDFAFFAVFLWLGIVAWRRFGAPYGLYVLVGLAIPLSVPHLGYPLESMPRFCLTLFPAFLALASLATTRARDQAILVLSSTMLAVATVAWATGYWVS